MVATSLVVELADAIEARYRALVLLAGFAGLRTGESLGLRRCDIDLLHAEVRVAVQAQGVVGERRMLFAPKTAAGRRTVSIPRIVAEALDSHLATFPPGEAEAPVFVGSDGGPLRRATLSKAWRTGEGHRGAGRTYHDLRHHAATLAARMPGITTKELMARIGHASPRRRSSTSTHR